jgi:YD repeat-containing protein
MPKSHIKISLHVILIIATIATGIGISHVNYWQAAALNNAQAGQPQLTVPPPLADPAPVTPTVTVTEDTPQPPAPPTDAAEREQARFIRRDAPFETYSEKDSISPSDPNAIIDPKLIGGVTERIGGDPQDLVPAANVLTPTSKLTDGEILVGLYGDDTRAAPGEQMQFTLRLSARGEQTGLAIGLNLPANLVLGSEVKGAAFDANTGQVIWRDLAIDAAGIAEIPFTLAVLPDARGGDVEIGLRAANDAADRRQYTLGQPIRIRLADAASDIQVDDKGGRFELAGGRVKIEFASGALSETRRFTASLFTASVDEQKSLTTAKTAENASPLTFEMQPDTAFAAPVTVTIDLAGLLSPEFETDGREFALAYHRVSNTALEQEDATGRLRSTTVKRVDFEPVASRWDPATQTLVAVLKHFSGYSVTDTKPFGRPQSWKLSANLGEVSLYRGASTFAYPIQLPELPGGGQPSLSINYSSAGADALSEDETAMGAGWSLSGIPKIQRGVKLERRDYTSNNLFNRYWEGLTDQYYRLSLGGQDYNLVYKSTPAAGIDEYVPESYAPVRAVRCSVGINCYGINVPAWTEVGGLARTGTNQCGLTTGNVTPVQHYWQVWTADGVRYVFGTDASSTTHVHIRNDLGANQIRYQSWYLRRVASPLRDNPAAGTWSAEYAYYKEPRSGEDGFRDGQQCTSLGANWDTRTRPVEIYYGNSQSSSQRYRINLNYNQLDNVKARLSTVQIRANYSTAVRTYTTAYSGQLNSWRLQRIRENGFDGISFVQLPDTTFEYVSGTDFSQNRYRMLSAVNNGYGGRVEFDYTWRTTGSGHNTVSNRRVLAGVGPTRHERYDFNATTACFNNVGQACYFGRDDLFPDNRGGIVGYQVVTKQVGASANGPWQSVTVFQQHHAKEYNGQIYETRNYDASGQTVLSSSQIEWYARSSAVIGQPAGVWSSVRLNEWEFLYSDVNSANPPHGTRRTQYEYDTLGSVTAKYEHGFTTLSGDEKSTHYAYGHDWTNWIVAKIRWENRFDTITPNAVNALLRTQTFYYYDNNHTGNGSAPNGKGLVTRIDRGGGGAGGPWVSETYAYNSAGMPTTVTNARGYATTYTYVPETLQVSSVTNVLNQTTHYCYFGIANGCGAVGAPNSQPWGGYHYTIEPNGAQVDRVWYDAWGRVTSVVQPGDSDSIPTQSYVYGDGGLASVAAPFKIETWQREATGCGNCAHPTFTFYDGLGRVAQVRSETVDGQWQRVTNTTYDALGRTERTYVPAAEAFSYGVAWPTGWNSRPSSLQQYDMLGRVTSVTGPDGTTTTYAYGADTSTAHGYAPAYGAVVSTVDANGHAKQHVTDGLGRLIRAREFTGTTHPRPVYGESRYVYGWLDQLTQVTGPDGSVTTMTYDNLLRKTAMSDPDMGSWSYMYDANGNLIHQSDARPQTQSFSHDALDRLRYKYANGIWVGYDHYDEAGISYSTGRRTYSQVIVNSAGTNWYTRWYYDARGRVTIERQSVEGIGMFRTAYSYDSADRVVTTTYPGGSNDTSGEAVTTTYNNAGEPQTLTGASTYVGGASYNALGQPTWLSFGNTASTTYGYYGLDTPGGWGNTNYGRLWRILTSRAGGTLLDLQHGYDAVGNVNHIYFPSAGEDNYYAYDDLDRLTSATIAGVNESYSYNVSGNLMGKADMALNYPAYNAARPHAVTNTSVNGIATGSFGYDASGNMTTRVENGVTYNQSWDAENRLTSVVVPNTVNVTSYTYDANGKRVKKSDPAGRTIYVGEHYEVFYPCAVPQPINAGSIQLNRATNTLSWSGGTSPYFVRIDDLTANASYSPPGGTQFYGGATPPGGTPTSGDVAYDFYGGASISFYAFNPAHRYSVWIHGGVGTGWGQFENCVQYSDAVGATFEVAPTATPTNAPTNTPAPPTATPTSTPTATPTNTPAPGPTNTPTPTATPTPGGGGGACTDDFNRADSTNLGSAWNERAGDLAISANTLRNAPAGAATTSPPARPARLAMPWCRLNYR